MNPLDLLSQLLRPEQWHELARAVSLWFSLPFWVLALVLILMRPYRWVDRLGLAWKLSLGLVAVRYLLERRSGVDLSETFYTSFVFILAFVLGMAYAGLLAWQKLGQAIRGYRGRRIRGHRGRRSR